jgi:hypothetical protein
MRKFLLATTALIALSTIPAMAADQAPPVKAPPGQEFVNWTSSGWYVGLGTYGGVAQASVNGSSTLITGLVSSNVEASGGGIELEGGYVHGNTNLLGLGNWYMLDVKGGYQNISGGNSVPGGSLGFSSRWSVTEQGCVGADVIAAITSVLGNVGTNWPTVSPNILPANIQVGIPKQCFGVEAREFGLGGDFGGATGTTVGVAPGVYTAMIYPTLGTSGKPNGGAIKAWASVDWNTKGLTFTNVFGKSGPVGVTPGVSEGTTYMVGVDFLVASLFH